VLPRSCQHDSYGVIPSQGDSGLFFWCSHLCLPVLPAPALHRTQDGVPPRPGPLVPACASTAGTGASQVQADGTGQVQVALGFDPLTNARQSMGESGQARNRESEEEILAVLDEVGKAQCTALPRRWTRIICRFDHRYTYPKGLFRQLWRIFGFSYCCESPGRKGVDGSFILLYSFYRMSFAGRIIFLFFPV
jgi:hypothetical protein